MRVLNRLVSAVVVHPWMVKRSPDVEWLAWAIADSADRLEAGIVRAQQELGAPRSGREASWQLAGLFAALDEVTNALTAHGRLMAEHGPLIDKLLHEMDGRVPFTRAWRACRTEIRRRTDELSEADVRLRRAVEAATAAVPFGVGWSTVLGTQARPRPPGPTRAVEQPGHGHAAGEAAPGGELALTRGDLALLSTDDLERTVLGDPRVRTVLAQPVPRAEDAVRAPHDGLDLPGAAEAEAAHATGQLSPREWVRLARLSGVSEDDVACAAAAAGVAALLPESNGASVADSAPPSTSGRPPGSDRDRPRSPRANPRTSPDARSIVAVRDVFAALGADAAYRLALLWPALVGPAEGAPLEVRARANRELVRAALVEARRSDVALEAQAIAQRMADGKRLLRRARAGVMLAYAEWEGLRSLISVPVTEPFALRLDLRARIRLYLHLISDRPVAPGESTSTAMRPLLSFSAEGRGRVIELVGGLRPGVDRLAVLVPGTGSGMFGYHLPHETCEQLVAADPTGRTAAVCWVGADFPMALLNESSQTHFALAGAPALVRTLVSLRLAHEQAVEGARTDSPGGGPLVTVIGHSYGASLVGASEMLGLPADQVVHLASAGAGPGVTSVRDYAQVDALGNDRVVERFACTARRLRRRKASGTCARPVATLRRCRCAVPAAVR